MEIAKLEGRCAYYNKCVYNGRIRSSADYFVGSYTKANQKIEIKISKASA